MLNILLILFVAYLIGSFPTALLAGKILKKIDIREHGSGNAGATNVFRVLGWKAGLVVLFIDMFKGFASVWWIPNIAVFKPEFLIYIQIIAGLAAIAGHIWTIFAQFRGGKGVGTAAGVFLGLQPGPVIVCLIIFIGVVFKTKYVSLGSMIAAFLLPIILLVQKYFLLVEIQMPMIVLSILLAILIIVTHRSNINRLIQGTESEFSFGKKKEEK
jgi:glycerol-3-phosphate acyltransferase PlsY